MMSHLFQDSPTASYLRLGSLAGSISLLFLVFEGGVSTVAFANPVSQEPGSSSVTTPVAANSPVPASVPAAVVSRPYQSESELVQQMTGQNPGAMQAQQRSRTASTPPTPLPVTRPPAGNSNRPLPPAPPQQPAAAGAAPFQLTPNLINPATTQYAAPARQVPVLWTPPMMPVVVQQPVLQQPYLQAPMVQQAIGQQLILQPQPVWQQQPVYQPQVVYQQPMGMGGQAQPVFQQPILQQQPIYQPQVVYQQPMGMGGQAQPVFQQPIYQPQVVYQQPYQQPMGMGGQAQPVFQQPILQQQPIYQPQAVYQQPVYQQPLSQSQPILYQPQTVYSSPTNRQPVYSQTIIQQPVYQQPMVQQPMVQQPVFQQPVLQQPGLQQPMVQQPVFQQPVYQQPMVQQPVFQQPVLQQPGLQQPGLQQPGLQQPVFQQPVQPQPGLQQPQQQIFQQPQPGTPPQPAFQNPGATPAIPAQNPVPVQAPGVLEAAPPPTTIQPLPIPTLPRQRRLLNSTALTPPSVTLQTAISYFDDEFSGRARLAALYPLTPGLLVGSTIDFNVGNGLGPEGVNINELYLAASVPGVPSLRIVAGQLDLTSYFDRNSFAKDSTTQFFNPIFGTNPSLSAANLGSRPGVLVNWSLTDDIEARAVGFSSARSISDFAFDGFAAELGFRVGNAIVRGTYVSSRDVNADPTARSNRQDAFGVNAEWFIPESNLGLFARYGRLENQAQDFSGDSFAAGINVLDIFSPNDRLGVAYGRNFSDELRRRQNNGRVPDALEVFYDFTVLPNLRLGFSLQQVDDFSETIAGFRVRTEFDVTPRGSLGQ